MDYGYLVATIPYWLVTHLILFLIHHPIPILFIFNHRCSSGFLGYQWWLKISVLWNMKQCSPVEVNWHFRGPYPLLLQISKIAKQETDKKNSACIVLSDTSFTVTALSSCSPCVFSTYFECLYFVTAGMCCVMSENMLVFT